VVLGSVSSAGLALVSATQVFAAGVSGFFGITATASSGYDVAFSLALVGAGHLVGLSVGLAMLAGLLIAWAGAVPILTSLQPAAAGITLAAHTSDIWRHQVRFIGAGTIAISAIWTLATLAKPVVGGLINTMAASKRTGAGDDRDRDLTPPWIIALTAACLIVVALLTRDFVAPTTLGDNVLSLVIFAVPFVLIGGFLIAAICGYMAGLIGASNSPVSGVGILSIVLSASMLILMVRPTPTTAPALVAFALFVTAIVFACATISNDNLQDLKTGQLVGASPWRQQIALIVGVLAGAAVIPPILNILARAQGFAGAANVGVISATPLAAPQATLISALAQGVVAGQLDWKMIGIGVAIGIGLIALDAALGAMKWIRIPPLAVGIGIYLPMSATFAVVIGAVIGHWYNGRAARAMNPSHAERLGVLVASGLIVGESLFGVFTDGLVWAFGKDAPLALVPATFAPANALGVVSFVAIVVALYGWMLKRIGPARA
jgi:putative OPT family oligopeptide transporter